MNRLKSVFLSLFCLSSVPGMAGDVRSLDCTVGGAPFRYRDVSCKLPPSERVGHYLLRALFSGGHDDTEAAILMTQLAGGKVDCAPGSKPALMGEYGEVTVDCRVLVPASELLDRTFTAKVVWSHANFLRAEMTREESE